MDSVLLTGGTGFIGSHVAVEIAQSGLRPVLLDNLGNSRASVADRVSAIVGHAVPFVHGDIRDGELLRRVLREHRVGSVIHLASLKSVGESARRPLAYWDNNVTGTLTLLEAMQDTGVRRLVFSGSATVYGEPRRVPVDESHPLAPLSPYGQTKVAIERMLRDLHASDAAWKICMLRYFNPVGAHPSGLIGENPVGVPDNLMPFLLRVASGHASELPIFGTDYPTADGTAIRDFVHVCDLATGHVRALQHLEKLGCEAINLGTGTGASVMEMVRSFERVNGVKIPCRMEPRRPGDIGVSCADPSLAAARLDWRAQRTLDDMCRDAWRWQRSPAAQAP